MDKDTIQFLRALCAKAKEVAVLCDTYLEQQAREKTHTAEKSIQIKETGSTSNRLIPLAKWNQYHDWPTLGTFRWMIFSSYKTGADYFIRRAGRRLLVCEKSFFEWMNMSPEQRLKVSPDAILWKEKYGR